jgi:hypothetical protein
VRTLNLPRRVTVPGTLVRLALAYTGTGLGPSGVCPASASARAVQRAVVLVRSRRAPAQEEAEVSLARAS